MDVEIKKDDLNQKFLTSLAPEWLMHTIVWRNRSDLDTMSLDDLYNYLKVYESEVQKKSEPNSQNMAFISSAKHSSENEDGNTVCVPTASTNVPTTSASIDEDDIEEMDIKWNMALQSMRADKFWKKTEKKISIQGSDVAGFDKSKDWSYMENNEKDHALVADEVAPTEFALMANTSAESKVFDNSLCSKDCKKNNDSLNSKITDLTDKLFDENNYIYQYKLALAQVVSRLVKYKEREVKYIKKIRTLEFYNESNKECIETLKKKLETLKKEKEGVDRKLAGLLTASKNLNNLIESQRSDKNKEGLGYTVFVKPKDCQSESKTDKKETPKKPPVKYAEQYRKPNKKPNVRGNQRKWNNLKSHQLGPDFVMKKKACFNSGDFNHLAYDCRKRVKKNFTPRPVAHRPYKPSQRLVITNMNDARPNKTFFNKHAHSYANRPVHRTSVVRSPYRAPWVPTVNRNYPPVNRKFSTGSRKFPTASRKFPTGSTKGSTADRGRKGKAVKPSAFKRIFRYLKGHPKLGLWYPKESPFDLVAYSDSDYGGATQDRKYTTRGCQFLGRRLISWQCKKQTIVATSTTEAEYVVAASCCGQGEHNVDFHPMVDFIEASPLRARIAQSSALPTVTDAPASPQRDVSQGEAYPTDSGFIADHDRTLPHDSAPRVTSSAAVEGSMQQTIFELTALCTSLQRQLSELTYKFQAQEVEINRLKERIKLSMDEGEAATKRISDDTEEMTTVLTSMDAATVLASGVVDIPTGSGSIPTTSTPVEEQVPTGKEIMVESETSKNQKAQEQIDAQVAREMEEQLKREDHIRFEQIARDVKIARIHVEKELHIMIDGLDINNEIVAKYLQEYHQFALELPIERRIELISDLVKYQDHYPEVHKYQSQQKKPQTKKQKRDYYMAVIKNNLGWKIEGGVSKISKQEAALLKRKGIRLEQEEVKKMKTSVEVPEEVKSSKEVSKEKIKDMIQLVPIEERAYWKITRLEGSLTSYQFFTDLLKHLDRDDLNQLWILVKETLSNRPLTSDKEMEINLYASGEGLPSKEGSSTYMISYKRQVKNYLQMANDLVLKIYKIANSPRQKADDCDAFNSDVDEALTAQTIFMANLSSADPVTDETGPSYDSNILSEIQDHDHYQDAICAHHEEHVMHDSVVQIIHWYLDFGCSKHMTRDRSQLVNFVQKFLGTVKFGNDHVAKIMGYRDYQIRNMTISRVYYVEGLGHNLFSVGQGLVRGLPKLKFEKDHLCSACAMGKSTKKKHKPKSEDTNQEKLYLLHMDLYGPMRVKSVNGKKYIFVIVDDYSRFTWVKFLRSKDETLDFIIKFLKMIQVRLSLPV
nr:putative ribonuclease H-like domain-containing protein [Tanacetum cinerariifolium]